MNPTLLAPLVALVLALLWWSGRRRAPLDPRRDITEVTALNRAQIALVQAPASGASAAPMPVSERPQPVVPVAAEPAAAASMEVPEPDMAAAGARVSAGAADPGSQQGDRFESPRPPARRQELLRRLSRLARGDDRQRLEAMALARRWGDRAALPVLRRGLRDPHPAVMLEAARAMERFRGRPPAAAVFQPARPAPSPRAPRSVARTR